VRVRPGSPALTVGSLGAYIATFLAITAGWWFFRLRLAQHHVRESDFGFWDQVRRNAGGAGALGAQLGLVIAIVLGAVLSGGAEMTAVAVAAGFLGGFVLSLRFSTEGGHSVEIS
jgi:hypothetical protein